MIIRTKSYSRAGLVGNPSDGYFGKTIAFLFKDFSAEVTLYETPELEIMPKIRDKSFFSDIAHLAENVRTFGYYGGIRLLKATIKRFYDYCQKSGIVLDNRNFTLTYKSYIPHQVGLAGSSAIVTACLRALCTFYQVTIAKPVMANLVLSVENEELGISAGLQDRVAQVYEGMVYMDFDKAHMEREGYGRYESLDVGSLPPLYIAYDASLAEQSAVFHNNIRERFERGEPEVMDAMRFWADLTDQVRDCLERGDPDAVGSLLNANFDKRREIYRLSDRNIQMVETARSTGASAKFAGSGGAIVGTYEDDAMYRRLEDAFAPLNIRILKPTLA
jgi:glucuronokinase